MPGDEAVGEAGGEEEGDEPVVAAETLDVTALMLAGCTTRCNTSFNVSNNG